MKTFNKVVIFGTGLIGGSLGLALKKKRMAGVIIGFSLHRKNALLAKKKGVIDSVGADLSEVKDANLVILATPVESIIKLARKIKNIINRDCIVIDVGSTKQEISSELDSLFPNFVGCHPLAGSEKKGISNLEEGIFEGSICVVTPTLKTSKTALEDVKLLWKNLGAKVVLTSPKMHDRILAFTSHLPHVLAFSLISCVPEKFLDLSSTSLRDATRISASDPYLWSQIFMSNKDNLLFAISHFEKSLSDLKLALKKKDKAFLAKKIKKANKKREILR